MKSRLFILLTILTVLVAFCIASAQAPAPEHEEITLTTYYPAPYGDYINLAVSGNADSPALAVTPTLTATANNDTLTALHINPTFNDAGFANIQHNGLIVQDGNVGIGTTSPGRALEVNGVVKTEAALLDPVNPNTIANPVDGMICCDSSDNKIKQYNSSTNQWNPLGGGGGFGNWVSKSNNTIYQAESDGFVIAVSNPHFGGVTMEGITDSFNPPSTVRCKQVLEVPHTRRSITMPVKKMIIVESNKRG